ncbi:MAG: short-chain dehydrogenase, partial [Paucimonas sp.]|nr:short-chain dehydrogenase [Paucimonas sp.]
IITGAGSWICLAAARKLIEKGARVVLADQSEAFRAEAEAVLGDAGCYLVGDLRDDAFLDRIVSTAKDKFGGVNMLLSAAASYAENGLDTSRGQWNDTIDVNVVSPALLTRKVADHMREGDAIVYVASCSARVSQHNKLVYNITKAALLMLAKASAQRLAPRRIRVNSLSPGWTWSRAIERRWGTREHADAFAGEFQPMGRLADPEEVADAALYLLSDQARFVTGTDLAVDGGYEAIGPEAMGQAWQKYPPIP